MASTLKLHPAHADLESVLVTEDAIKKRIKKLGAEVAAIYGEEEITVISIINGAILFTAGMALALGSAVSLILVAVLIGLLGYRSVREETTLRDELEGYAEYMQRVRHRWIPGVW